MSRRVLKYIGHPGGTSDVVLQHPEPPVGTADDVDTGYVNAPAIGRLYPEGGPVKVIGAGHQAPGQDPALEDPTSSIEVSEEGFERIHPLDDRQGGPLLRRDHPWHQVERERPLLARPLKSDAAIAESPVPGTPERLKVLWRSGLQDLEQASSSRARHSRRLEHLIRRDLPERGGQDVVVE